MVAEMTTPQIAAAAPVQYCPRCGRQMQLLSTTEATYSYACYGHSLQNGDSNEPFYLNIHIRSLGKDGKIKVIGE